jgi:hypothetical protein
MLHVFMFYDIIFNLVYLAREAFRGLGVGIYQLAFTKCGSLAWVERCR